MAEVPIEGDAERALHNPTGAQPHGTQNGTSGMARLCGSKPRFVALGDPLGTGYSTVGDLPKQADFNVATWMVSRSQRLCRTLHVPWRRPTSGR